MTPHSFHPTPRTLMGPGPSDVYPRVLTAMAQSTLGHLDPEFVELMDDVKKLLRLAFRTDNELTLPISGPGTAGMQACVDNLVQPGDTVVVCVNGVFGARIAEMVRRVDGEVITVEDEWGQPVDPQKLEDALRAHPKTRVVAFVHAETSTGAWSDAETLGRIARQHGCLTIVDAVTSLGGIPVEVGKWRLDAVYSGTQKCLSCPPGLSPVTFSDRAVDAIQTRTTPVRSWFLDMGLQIGYWGSGAQRSYHHTAPINSIYGLHEALVILLEEGLENSWQRHQDQHQALLHGVEELGFEFVVDEACRLPQLNAIRIPDGIDDASTRRRFLDEFHLEIGAGLGQMAGEIWRVGLMGYGAREENVSKLVDAFSTAVPV